MNAVLDGTRDALMLVVSLGLPLLAVGLVAGLLAGWLSQLTGISDPSISTALRAAAIIGALWWAGGPIAERVVSLTDEAWRTLPALGRAGVPAAPGAETDAPSNPAGAP